MRSLAIVLLAITTVAFPAFAHEGHAHTYMGTVVSASASSLVVKTTDGHDVKLATASSTSYVTVDGHPASAAAVKAGKRVVVKMAADGKVAATVKVAK